MKKLLFAVLAICAIGYAQKGVIADKEPVALSADKIISIKETLVAEKTIIEKVYTDTLGNFEMKPRLIPQHIETEQARSAAMLNLKENSVLKGTFTLDDSTIAILYYKIPKEFKGLRPWVGKMDVK
jgi:hypothetical protein